MDLRGQAVEDMVRWLSDEHELGKPPYKIEVAGEFQYDDAYYYILKYKKSIFGKWLVGVCGYDEDGEECGHTFSEFEVYDEKTAKDKCIKMIEYLKEFWRNRALAEMERRGVSEEEFENMSEEEWKKKGEEADKKTGNMNGFVLLQDNSLSFENIINNLKTEWDINVPEDETEFKDGNLVFNLDNNLVAISLMDAPVPDGEAEYFAESNYMWKDAVETTKKHKAHILVAVINRNGDSLEAASIFTKVSSTCLKEKNALGIYTSGTVFQPEFYTAVASVLKDDDLPIPDWIYIGFGRDEKGNAAYTYGLEAFGKLEIEIINSSHDFEELRNFLYYVCEYVIKENVFFRDGETISFSSDNVLKVTKSKAVRVDGDSIKIWY